MHEYDFFEEKVVCRRSSAIGLPMVLHKSMFKVFCADTGVVVMDVHRSEIAKKTILSLVGPIKEAKYVAPDVRIRQEVIGSRNVFRFSPPVSTNDKIISVCDRMTKTFVADQQAVRLAVSDDLKIHEDLKLCQGWAAGAPRKAKMPQQVVAHLTKVFEKDCEGNRCSAEKALSDLKVARQLNGSSFKCSVVSGIRVSQVKGLFCRLSTAVKKKKAHPSVVAAMQSSLSGPSIQSCSSQSLALEASTSSSSSSASQPLTSSLQVPSSFSSLPMFQDNSVNMDSFVDDHPDRVGSEWERVGALVDEEEDLLESCEEYDHEYYEDLRDIGEVVEELDGGNDDIGSE
jgi:hypothetical protein